MASIAVKAALPLTLADRRFVLRVAGWSLVLAVAGGAGAIAVLG